MEIIEVRSVEDPLMEQFLELPRTVYEDDPIWAPENGDIVRFSFMQGMGKGPVKIRPFVAMERSRPLSRCCAIIHQRAVGTAGKKTGWFGYFETLQGEGEAVKELMEAVTKALKEEGCSTMVGPRSELMTVGLQTSGFDLPHTWMTPHNPPYYENVLLNVGFTVEKELISLIWTRDSFLDKTSSVHGYKIRELDKSEPEREIKIYNQLNNSIFSGRDMFIPHTLEEDTATLSAFFPFIDKEMVLFAETENGDPVGMMVCVPDLNQMSQEGRVDRARIISVGLLSDHRGKGVGTMMSSHLKIKLLKKRYNLLEGSWIQKDNKGPQALGNAFGAEAGRKFRIYQKPID